MSMPPADLTICREIHAGLTSKERNNINYLFLEPVDPTYFPDYPTIVKRPMDLRTLAENLDNGTYATKEEFYDDARLIFDNAILFNKDRPESSFVVDLAKRMTKALDRVRKTAEKKAARLAGGSVSSKEGEKKKGGEGDPKPVKEGEKKKKLSIKLKRQKSTADIASSGGEEDAKPPPKKKAKLKLKLSKSSSEGGAKLDYSPGKYEEVPMTATRRAQCYKVLSSLKRRQPSTCKWFHKPVSDPAIVKDYKEKIKDPMDLSSMSSKLDKKQYKTVDQFVTDLRRIAANCLQYNHTINDDFRPLATDFLSLGEDLCRYFIAKNETKTVYPSLLYCWTDCLKAINDLINMTNPEDGHQTAHFFLFPVSFYCGGVYPEGYLDKVKQPTDFGTIVQNLITGQYKTLGAYVSDCRRVADNCRAFYAGDPEGLPLIDKADRMSASMEKNLGPLLSNDTTEKGNKAREKAASKMMVIKRPEKEFLRSIMRELRDATYTDKAAKITEKATLHFEKPVDTAIFTDYPEFVDSPMDLETVDRKIESGSYATPEDFEYDISLIFKNCERYNGPKKNIHMVNLGKHTAKIFRKLFAERLRGGTGAVAKRPSLPTSANRVTSGAAIGGKMAGKMGGKMGGKKRPASPMPEEKSTKRVSIKGPSRASSSKSIASSSSAKSGSKKVGTKLSQSPKIVRANPDAPMALHVAIQSIKESSIGRRSNKDLEGWEYDCMKFLKQMLRHPWLLKERPKYIYHVPVHYLFPTLREAYDAKVKHPMDLTTVEVKLLQAAYNDPDEFISDIALVFSNAITFNKEGYDAGDPMSCAYYDASTHLLQYVRWLSLELLQPYLSDCSKGPVVQSGPAAEWKLTVRNREFARKEMEDIVFNELVDKTDPEDNRYSWSEKECEKLLRSLTQTSDRKHMNWFIQMNFPPDYTAFISKPIAWDLCSDKLKGRKYNTIGEIVADLRLIFTNALKYNEGARQVSSISAAAYDSAIHMSGKLEAAIDQMLLNIGDRIGRERIDMIVAQREMEAKEREEEERRRREWERDNPGATMEVKTKLRIVNRGGLHRKKVTDFDFPFYDEEDEQEDSHTDLQHAKRLYENQKEARAKLQELMLSIGRSVFQKHKEAAAAKEWAVNEARKIRMERIRAEEEKAAEAKKKEDEAKEKAPTIDRGAFVSSALKVEGRTTIKMSIQRPKKPKRKLTSF